MTRRTVAAETLLARLPLFAALDAAALARLAGGATRVTLARGQTLFRKGERTSGMFVVVYGEIKLIASSPARGPRLSGIVGPGRSFGEPVMFLERAALVDAQAASDSLLLLLPQALVFDEIERNPKFARRMLAGLAQRVERLVHELDRQAIGSGAERLAAYLLRHRSDADGTIELTLPAPKAEIASLLNMTPEHFSRVLHDLAAAGALGVQGRRITVPDAALLEAAARRR